MQSPRPAAPVRLVALACAAIALLSAACFDDGDPAPTPTIVRETPNPAIPTPTPSPSPPDPNLGDHLRHEGDFEGAIGVYGSIAADDDKDAEERQRARLSQAQLLQRASRFPEARDVLIAYLAEGGPSADGTAARFLLASVLDDLDDPQGALDSYQSYIAANGPAASFAQALDVLKTRGASLLDVELPHARFAIPVYYLVATAEASSNLARYDGVRYGLRGNARELRTLYSSSREAGFGAEVKRRIMLGTYVLSAGYYDAYYLKAQQVRTLILRDYEEAFAQVDAVAMPTTPSAAFTIGEKTADPLQMYLGDVFTVSANLAGLPAISIPCGFTEAETISPKRGDEPAREGGFPARLPVGLQLTGRRFDEATLLRIGDAYERDTAWSNQLPPLASR